MPDRDWRVDPEQRELRKAARRARREARRERIQEFLVNWGPTLLTVGGAIVAIATAIGGLLLLL